MKVRRISGGRCRKLLPIAMVAPVRDDFVGAYPPDTIGDTLVA
jgi:hypothetical protein